MPSKQCQLCHSQCHWFFLFHLYAVDSWCNSMVQEAENTNEKGFFKICQGHHMWFKSEQSIFCRFVQFTCNSAPARVYKVISNILISCWFWLQLLVIIALLVAIRVPQKQPFLKAIQVLLKSTTHFYEKRCYMFKDFCFFKTV